jgi:Ca-activated chloride channel family protein
VVRARARYSSLPIAETKPSREHDALPQLWARSRIAQLSDFTPDQDANRTQITELGLQYSLLTAHTSFIAVLEQVRNPGGVAADSPVPQPLPLGVADTAETYESGAEPELLWLLIAALGIVAITHMRRRSTCEVV